MNKHLKINGTSIDLTPIKDNPFEGYTSHNHPLTEACRSDSFKESFQYVNESIHPLCLVGTNGLLLEIKGSLKNRNRLVVVRELVIGSDVKIDLTYGSRILGKSGDELVTYVSNVIEREKNNNYRVITIYYVIDTTFLNLEPEGVLISQLGIVISLPCFKETLTLVNERKPTVVDENGDPEKLWGGGVQLVYIPESKNNKKSIYTTLGNNVIEIKPSTNAGLNPGLHVLSTGTVSIPTKHGKKSTLLFKVNDFSEHGYYESGKKLIESLVSKDRSVDILASFKSDDNASNDSGPSKRFNPLDEYKIGNSTLRECVETLGETIGIINKVKTDFRNVVK